MPDYGTPEFSELLEDRDAIDEIAVGLGTQAEWNGGDCLEWIANVIGRVRPHPGDSSTSYVREFREATGRDAPEDAIDEDYDEHGGER